MVGIGVYIHIQHSGVKRVKGVDRSRPVPISGTASTTSQSLNLTRVRHNKNRISEIHLFCPISLMSLRKANRERRKEKWTNPRGGGCRMDWIPRIEGRIRKEEEVNQIKSKKNDVQYRHGQLSPPPKKRRKMVQQIKEKQNTTTHYIRFDVSSRV